MAARAQYSLKAKKRRNGLDAMWRLERLWLMANNRDQSEERA